MNTQLKLYNGTDWVEMPLKEDIPISLNFAITDIRSPESVKSSESKTVIIPFSNESVQFFEWIHRANVALQTFDPQLKTRAEVYHANRRTLRGYLQLLKVNKIDDGTVLQGEFECSLIGDSGNIFTDIGDMYLHELDLSDLDHALTPADTDGLPGSPSPTVGAGYAYGFVDYGIGNTNNTDWLLKDLKPGVFEREYLLRIFEEFGYTWTSNFLDSAYYRRRWIPCVNEGRLKLSTSTINASQFYAGRPSDLTNQLTISSYYYGSVDINAWGTAFPNYYTFGNGTPPPPAFVHSQFLPASTLIFGDETTSPWFDGSTVYNNSTGIFTAPISAYYEFGSTNTFLVDFINSPSGATQILPLSALNIELHTHIRVAGGGLISAALTTLTVSSQTGLGTLVGNTSVITPSTLIPIGTQIEVVLIVKVLGSVKYLNAGNAEVTGGTPQLRVTHVTGSTFYGKITNADLQIGNTVTMNDTIPREYKVRDFFKSIIQTFNLRVEPSRNNPYNLIIEPHYDFYNFSTNELDWTDKLDVSKQQEIIPMGELDWKTFSLSYKQDSDYYNTDYKQQTGFTYGDQLILVNNEFIKNDKKLEVIYSPTPIAKVVGSPMTVPKIYKQDASSIKPMRANIRVLYWGGMISCPTYNYNGLPQTQYPYVGHVDNPINPTLDLCFDNPFLLYWNLINQTYTNNNIYNAYWKRYLEEITDPDSKIWRADFYLDEVDISKFTFRDIVYVVDSYWYVNKIIDYNPLKKDTCRVELLKLKTAPNFTPEVIIGGGVAVGAGIGQAAAVGETSGASYRIITANVDFNYAGNNNAFEAQSYGQNNINMGGLIVGEGNVIS